MWSANYPLYSGNSARQSLVRRFRELVIVSVVTVYRCERRAVRAPEMCYNRRYQRGNQVPRNRFSSPNSSGERMISVSNASNRSKSSSIVNTVFTPSSIAT